MSLISDALTVQNSDSKSKNFAEVVSNGEVVFTAAVDGEYNVKFLNIKPGIFNGSTYYKYDYQYTDEGAEGLEPREETTYTILYAALCREDKILMMSRLAPKNAYWCNRSFWYTNNAKGFWFKDHANEYEHRFSEGNAGAGYIPNDKQISFGCGYPIYITKRAWYISDEGEIVERQPSCETDSYSTTSSFSIGGISSGMLSPLSPAEINAEYERMYKHFNNLNT